MKGVIALILLILSAVCAWSWYTERDARLSASAERDALVGRNLALTRSATGRLAELSAARALERQAGADLVLALRKLNAKPQTVIKTIIEVRPATTTVSLHDTILSGTPQWAFNTQFGRYRASGAVWPETKRLTIAIDQAPISLRVIMAHTKAGNWIGVVDVPDSTLKVGTLDVSVIQPQATGWLSKHRGILCLSVGGIICVLLKTL